MSSWVGGHVANEVMLCLFLALNKHSRKRRTKKTTISFEEFILSIEGLGTTGWKAWAVRHVIPNGAEPQVKDLAVNYLLNS